MWIIMLIMLAVYSYWDIREKQLPVMWVSLGVVVSAMCGFLSNLRREDMDIWRSILLVLQGMIPGMLLTVFALVLKGKIGIGDGLVLTVIGSLAGMEQGVIIWIAALGLSFIYSCILLVVCKKGRDYCFPFIPFYFWGTVVVYAAKAGESFMG